MKSFRHPEIARLHHELMLSPSRVLLRRIEGILRAISLIDPKREYPSSFIRFHITGFRPHKPDEEVSFDGKRLIEDLGTLAEALTISHPLPSIRERLYDAETLAERFCVSMKTIARWRKRGLLGCWYTTGDTKPRFAFTRRSIQHFVSRNLDLVRRGSAFRPMGAEERSRIVARARELVATGTGTLHPIAMCLSEETGRAVETIRALLRKHDWDNPSAALFDRAEQAQMIDEGEVIYQAFMDGESLVGLAGRFDKSPAEIGRILTAVRTRELAEKPIGYIYNASFDAPGAEAEILASPVSSAAGGRDSEGDIRIARVPSDLPAYLKELYRTPLFSVDEERDAFRRMNFLLHKAELLRRKIADDPASAKTSDVGAVDAEIDMALLVKKRIIQANLRLVVSIAKRHMYGRQPDALFELISDGNVGLIRAVEKFDYARGFRFSTYASWAIMRTYAKSVPDEITHATRYRTGHEEIFATTRDEREAESMIESNPMRIQTALANGLSCLNARERVVIEQHFGLGGAESRMTFKQISHALGISKESARQIEITALNKLRMSMGESGAELLAG
ncbi:MAG: sigma-70 family RNA polymerase sigma factor [Phycisphaerae bacterium]